MAIGIPSALPNPLTIEDSLDTLNSNQNLDFFQKTQQIFDDELNPNPFSNTPSTYFYDITTLTKHLSKSKKPIFLSFNVQSLNSKIDKLKSFIYNLKQNNIFPDIMAIQETWNIYYPEIIQIPGYSFVHKSRTKSNGGGVGFYVSDQHRFSLHPDFSSFTEKTFENITIEVEISKRKYLLSSIYRSPTPPPQTLPSQTMSTSSMQP